MTTEGMLERAAKCLESSARPPPVPFDKRRLPSQKKLHRAFWQPETPQVPSIFWKHRPKNVLCYFEKNTDPAAGKAWREMLYPLKTLEIIDQIAARQESIKTLDIVNNRIKRAPETARAGKAAHTTRRSISTAHAASPRGRTLDCRREATKYLTVQVATARYSTAQSLTVQSAQNKAVKKKRRGSVSAEKRAKFIWNVHPQLASLTVEELKAGLGSNRRKLEGDSGELGVILVNKDSSEKWDEAWDLFKDLDPDSRTRELKLAMMRYLSTSTRIIDTKRIIGMSHTIDNVTRDDPATLDTLLAHLYLQDFDSAVALFTTAVSHELKPETFVGTLPLVQALFKNNKPALLLNVLKALSVGRKARETESVTASLLRRACRQPNDLIKLTTLMTKHFQSEISLEDISTAKMVAVALITHADKIGDLDSYRAATDLLEAVGAAFPLPNDLWMPICEKVIGEYLRARHDEDLGKGEVDEAGAMSLRIYQAFRRQTSVVEWDREHHFINAGKLLYHLIKVASYRDSEEELLNILADTKAIYGNLSANVIQYVMGFYSRRGNIDAVEKYFKILKSDKVHRRRLDDKKDVWAFYTLMHAHATRIDPQGVREIMTRMQSKYDLPLDITTYNILMNAFRRLGDLESVMGVVSEVNIAGLRMDEYSYFAILSTCANRGDVDGFEDIVETMRNDGIKLSQSVLDMQVLVYINSGDVETAETVAIESSKNGNSANKTRMWNQLLTSVALYDTLHEFQRVAALMKSYDVENDGITYAIMMRAFARQRDPYAAKRILEEVLPREGIKPLALHYATVMYALADRGRFADAMQVYASQLEADVKPTTNTHISLLHVHLQAARAKVGMDVAQHVGLRYDTAEETLSKIVEGLTAEMFAMKEPMLYAGSDGVASLPSALFSELLITYQRQGAVDVTLMLLDKYEAAINHLEQNSRPVMPMRMVLSQLTFHFYLNDHSKIDKDWQLAVTTARRMTSSLRPNTHGKIAASRSTMLGPCMDVYIRAMGSQNRWTELIKELQELMRDGFELDGSNWNTYVKQMAMGGRHLEAFIVCERQLMQSYPANLPTAALMSNNLFEILPRKVRHIGDPVRIRIGTAARLRFALQKMEEQGARAPDVVKELAEIRHYAPQTCAFIDTLRLGKHKVVDHLFKDRDTLRVPLAAAFTVPADKTRNERSRRHMLRDAAAVLLDNSKSGDGDELPSLEPPSNRNLRKRMTILERRGKMSDLDVRIFRRFVQAEESSSLEQREDSQIFLDSVEADMTPTQGSHAHAS